MQAFNGFVEASVGAGMTFGSGGIASPLGWPLMAHGLDHFFTGINTFVSGSYKDTVSSQLLQKTGMSIETARTIDNNISTLGSICGAGALWNRNIIGTNLCFPKGFDIKRIDSNIFRKEIADTSTRFGRDGKAVEIIFKDGSKMDITTQRVKEWIPNLNPNAPVGTLQKVRFEEHILGSKGFKRTPTQYEIDFLNGLWE